MRRFREVDKRGGGVGLGQQYCDRWEGERKRRVEDQQVDGWRPR